MLKRIAALGLFVTSSLLIAQSAMNNDSIIKLCKASLSDDVIVATINANPGKYDISADSIIMLKNAGVSDRVIAAVVQKVSIPGVEPTTAGENSAMPRNNPPQGTATPAIEPADSGTSSGTTPIAPGVRIVIAPMGGFETYFAAAVREKKVPVKLTLDKASAEYFVVSTNTEWQGFVYGEGGSSSAHWSQTGGSANSHYGAAASSTRGLEASIMLIDAKTKDVVWAYEVHKNSHGALIFGTFGARGQQSIAEACAKHLKEYIEKGK